MTVERSPQQTDPLGTLSAWPLTAIVGIVVLGYAVLSTVRHGDQLAQPALAVLALAVLLTAVIVLIWATLPRHAPLRRTPFVVVLVLAVVAGATSAAATWGLNRQAQDDWGQIAFALLLVGMAQLRPAIELAVAAWVGGVAFGLIAALQWQYYAVVVDPAVYAIVAATPVFVLGTAAATYARIMVRTTERWQRVARAGIARLEPEVRDAAVRAVQQEQITLLNAAAAPLYSTILEQGAITSADIAQARDISGRLRQHALRLVGVGWFDDVIERAGVSSIVVDDPDDAIEHLTADQRAAFGAFVVALARLQGHPTESAAPVERAAGRPDASLSAIRVGVVTERRSRGTRARLVLSTELAVSPRTAVHSLMPYVSVLRIVARNARLYVRDRSITLGFGYDTV